MSQEEFTKWAESEGINPVTYSDTHVAAWKGYNARQPEIDALKESLSRATTDARNFCQLSLDRWAEISKLKAEVERLNGLLAAPTPEDGPAAWRITDGEGGYEYFDDKPSEESVAWAARYGREYEALHTHPASDELVKAAEEVCKLIKTAEERKIQLPVDLVTRVHNLNKALDWKRK